MLVKFFGRGSGGGDSPVNYLLGDDRDRDGASVLRGNAEITKELINSTDYARRYTSGCLSFEESYRTITYTQKVKIMDDFEKTLFSGLKYDQYNILWVQHTDKNDRLELNFLIPNQELRSGRRLQPFFHVADKRRVNAFQNVINLSFKLSDPHDPNKKRLNNPYLSRDTNLNSVDKAEYTEGQTNLIKHREEKARLTKLIYDLNDELILRHRGDMQDELVREGYNVVRVTKKSISIKSPKFDKNIRLDDPIFQEGVNLDYYLTKGLHRTLSNTLHMDLQREAANYAKRKDVLLKEAQDEWYKGLEIKSKWHAKRFNDVPAPKPYKLILDELEPIQKPKLQKNYNVPSFECSESEDKSISNSI